LKRIKKFLHKELSLWGYCWEYLIKDVELLHKPDRTITISARGGYFHTGPSSTITRCASSARGASSKTIGVDFFFKNDDSGRDVFFLDWLRLHRRYNNSKIKLCQSNLQAF